MDSHKHISIGYPKIKNISNGYTYILQGYPMDIPKARYGYLMDIQIGGYKMKYIISVDAGKHGTKCVGRGIGRIEDKIVTFPTKYFDPKNGDIEVESKSYRASCDDGPEYIIGEQGEYYDNNTSKTSYLHKLAIYTAITEIAGADTTPTVILIVGCPTSIFKNAKLKEEYRDYIKKGAFVKVNGKNYTINFEKVIIKCEGSGITYLEPSTFKDNVVTVIDIGGRNMNVGVYENHIPHISSLFSNNYGCTYLVSMVREALSSYFGEDIDLVTATRAIQEGGVIHNGVLSNDSADIVSSTIDDYMNNYVISSIKEKNINLSTMGVVAIGGTSRLIIDHLKKVIPHIKLSQTDPILANVKGFQIVGLVKAGVL